MTQNHIHQLIARGKTEDAIHALKSGLNENSSFIHELILVEGKYHEYQRNKITGTEHSVHLDVIKSQIDDSLLEICDRAYRAQPASAENYQQPPLSSKEIRFAILYVFKDIFRRPGKHVWVWLLITLGVFGILDLPAYMDQAAYPVLNNWPVIKPFFLTACFWGIFSLIFIDSRKLLRSYRNRPQLTTSVNSPIKGLLSFDFEDTAIFRELQREQDIDLCLSGILSDEFRLGILSGESGSGKTSLIRAGLHDALAQKELDCIVAKLTNEAPMVSIQKAIHQQLPEIPIADEGLALFDLLQTIITQKGSIILILDQFEQFFTHQKTAEARQSFIQQLNRCYADLPEAKILISLRRDFTGRLYEIQEVLLYNLLPRQNYFDLKKFTTEQAAAIFEVMAIAENIDYDADFVHQMCREELVSSEDQLISAVDIQILGFIIKGQQSSQRAFTRKAFQSMGGIDGLMQRFLQEHLDTPNYYNTDQNALKVLMAFIDIENQVSAGDLSQQQLSQKLASPQIIPHLTPILSWLEELRLITRNVSPDQPDTYELSHERLILPITSLAGRSLGEVEQANRILNKRTNEWLANEQKSRFLLTWSEYQAIREQNKRQLIRWGKNKDVKEKLLQATRRKFALRISAIALPLLLVLGWWGFRQTNWYIFNIEVPATLESLVVEYLDISEQGKILKPLVAVDWTYSYHLIARINDKQTRDNAFLQLVRTGTDSTLIDSIQSIPKEMIAAADKIESARYKYYALRDIAQAAAQTGDTTQAWAYLQQAVTAADKIESARSKSYALRDIAQAAAQTGDTTQAWAYLQQAVAAADKIDDARYKSDALRDIAQAAAQTGDTTQAWAYLQQAVAAADKIDHARYKSDALREIAQAAAQTGDTRTLQQAVAAADKIDDARYKSYALREIAQAAAQTGDTRTLQQAVAVADKIDDARYKSYALREIAQAAAQTGDTTQAWAYLQQAVAAADKIDDASSKSYALSAIAQAAAQTGDTTQSWAYLQQAVAATDKIEDASSKSYVLGYIAQAAAQTGDTRTLQQAVAAADKIDDASSKSDALREIAQAAAQTGDTTQAWAYLQQAVAAADKIDDASSKSYALRDIAQAAAQTGDTRTLQQAVAAADKIDDASSKSDALREIAQAAAQTGVTRTLQQAVASGIARLSGRLGDVSEGIGFRASIIYLIGRSHRLL